VELVDGKMAVIAAGGIFTGRDVLAAISAGAVFAQTYTGFIYRGPMMPALVQGEMLALMRHHGISSLDDLRGSNYRI
jgi:dihydroorotate dehydrogenase